ISQIAPDSGRLELVEIRYVPNSCSIQSNRISEMRILRINKISTKGRSENTLLAHSLKYLGSDQSIMSKDYA
ncbi:MAG: hypothetical protein V3T59_03245, partial [Desulfobacterales bacterium]